MASDHMTVRRGERALEIALHGDRVIEHARELAAQVQRARKRLAGATHVRIDGHATGRIDTSGAWLLQKIVRAAPPLIARSRWSGSARPRSRSSASSTTWSRAASIARACAATPPATQSSASARGCIGACATCSMRPSPSAAPSRDSRAAPGARRACVCPRSSPTCSARASTPSYRRPARVPHRHRHGASGRESARALRRRDPHDDDAGDRAELRVALGSELIDAG